MPIAAAPFLLVQICQLGIPWFCRRAGAGLIGLSLSYALSITDILNGVLTTSAETEQEMVSVERIQEYIQLPPQVPHTRVLFIRIYYGWSIVCSFR